MIHDARQATGNSKAEITLGADKGYDAKEFIDALQEMNVIPHVAQNTSGRRSAVPDAIAASGGYAISVTYGAGPPPPDRQGTFPAQ
jgi:hypothetical protein